MRHRKSGKKLGMEPCHRNAMFRNMARSLVTHGRIRTTVIRAKELRRVADGLITLALRNDLHSRRLAYKVLENHQLVQKLFDEIGPRFVGKPGGFTRVIRLGEPRKGDNAPLAVIEFTVDPAPAEAPAGEEKSKKKAAPAAEASAEEKPKKAAPRKKKTDEEPKAE